MCLIRNRNKISMAWFGVLLMSLLSTTVFGAELAVARAFVTAGYVTSIEVLSGGGGYTNVPNVIISGGGGFGAAATAIMVGDKVGLIIITDAGNGYSAEPKVVVDPPPAPDDDKSFLSISLVPKIVVHGDVGATNRIEWATNLNDLSGWFLFTNVVIRDGGTVVFDLSVDSETRYYRTIGSTSTPGSSKGPNNFVWIKPGSFMMGAISGMPDPSYDEFAHLVVLTKGFWICIYEVMQSDYEMVMKSNPSLNRGDSGGALPVEQVSWLDAVEFCRRYTLREQAARRISERQIYRLPTEAEWEYACRAGSVEIYSGDLESSAWYYQNSDNRTHRVTTKRPNPWGLYDMHGNVWEWCADWYSNYPRTTVVDPTGPTNGSTRVARGGSFNDPEKFLRSSQRVAWPDTMKAHSVGFRIVLGQN